MQRYILATRRRALAVGQAASGPAVTALFQSATNVEAPASATEALRIQSFLADPSEIAERSRALPAGSILEQAMPYRADPVVVRQGAPHQDGNVSHSAGVANAEGHIAAPDGPLGWWHHVLGISRYEPGLGSGIRVGVIDSGCASHPALGHVVDEGDLLGDGGAPTGAFVGEHGTHVAGLIGARPNENWHFAGVAPGVKLHTARVFKVGNDFADQGDIATAIHHLAVNRSCTILNISLTSAFDSQILREAIGEALSLGAICVCAAGNTGGNVLFPAAYPETLAVGAVGRTGWPGEAVFAPGDPAERGALGDYRLYVARFSCFPPPRLDCAAPGVHVISCIPGDSRGRCTDMSGTSMAAPLVSGALAIMAANIYETGSYATGAEAAHALRGALHRSCRIPPGMRADRIGWGIPFVE